MPREFVQTMRNSTLNKCPIQTFAQVRDVFLAELGLYPSEVCSASSTYASAFLFIFCNPLVRSLDLVHVMRCAWVVLNLH